MTSELSISLKDSSAEDIQIIPAVLNCKNEKWYVYDCGGAPLCKHIQVYSQTPGSTIREVSLLGYKDGDVCLNVSLSSSIDSSTFKRIREAYFGMKDIDSSSAFLDEVTMSIKTTGDEEFRRAVTILTEDNTIQSQFFLDLLQRYYPSAQLTSDEMSEIASFNFTPPYRSPWHSGWII